MVLVFAGFGLLALGQAVVALWRARRFLAVAESAIGDVARSGIRVLAVGVGTREGDVVPVLDPDGHATDIKRDADGNAVRSRLDEDLLRSLAQHTHGAYFAANRPGGELGRLLGAIEGLARTGRTQRLVERPVPRFPWFAGAAALLLALDRIRRRQRKHERETEAALHSERVAAAAAGLLLLLTPLPSRAQSAWAHGDRAALKGRYAEAESLYAQRLRRGGPDAVRVNLATARALAGKADVAEPELARLAERPRAVGEAAGYNLGTLLGERHADDEALGALRRVLEKNPGDADARWNYEVLLRRKQRPQDQKPPPNPRGGGGGGGGGQQPSQPRPRPQAPQPTPPSPQQGAPRSPSPQAGGMTREQAERLMNALEEMTRAEQQNRRTVRAVTEKRGRDW